MMGFTLFGIPIDYPVIIAGSGAMLIGISSGILSCFATLKQQSLLGDAIAHAALPGLCLAFLLTLNKHPLVLLTGATIAGFIGTLFIMGIINHSLLKEDTALGVILSVFFGVGMLLLTMIQKIPTARQSGLESYLFGNAASMLKEDIVVMAICTALIIIIISLLWKELKSMTFDTPFCKSLGMPVQRLDMLLISLIVIAIIIGLQTVGVILMSALLIAPGSAARQWSNKLGTMVCLSVLFSVIAGGLGVLISSSQSHLPTGPVIVVLISMIVCVSILLSPRGILVKWLKNIQNKHSIQQDTIIKNLYLLAQTHADKTHPHDIQTMQVLGGTPSQKHLQQLKNNAYIYHQDANIWGLTEKGIKHAHALLKRNTSECQA
jgi:manganese/zinc/iron transport system permease protein